MCALDVAGMSHQANRCSCVDKHMLVRLTADVHQWLLTFPSLTIQHYLNRYIDCCYATGKTGDIVLSLSANPGNAVS